MTNVNVGADKGKPDWRCFKDFMAREGPIKKELVVRLLRDAISLLSNYYRKLFKIKDDSFRKRTKFGKDR